MSRYKKIEILFLKQYSNVDFKFFFLKKIRLYNYLI